MPMFPSRGNPGSCCRTMVELRNRSARPLTAPIVWVDLWLAWNCACRASARILSRI